MTKQEILDYHFLRLAWTTAINLSKDPSTQVGAVLVSPDTRQVSVGYNGMPAGMEETEEVWSRPKKYSLVVHGELNCIMNCPFDTRGCTMYLTHWPCQRCLGHVRNAGVERIVYNESYANMTKDDLEIWNLIAPLFKEIKQLPDDAFLRLLKAHKDTLRLSKKF